MIIDLDDIESKAKAAQDNPGYADEHRGWTEVRHRYSAEMEALLEAMPPAAVVELLSRLRAAEADLRQLRAKVCVCETRVTEFGPDAGWKHTVDDYCPLHGSKSQLLLYARLRAAQEALYSLIDAGNDIDEMAESFIAARDVNSLRNYGSNIASIARRAVELQRQEVK